MQIYSIDTGMFKLDGGAMFGVVPKSIWKKENPSDENNMCNWAMRCMLVVDGDRRILIDTGMGSKQGEKFFSFYYPFGKDTLVGSIEKAGFSASDITDVILTHLHFDHCGGAVIRMNDTLALTFPNATYWSNKNHWEAATNPNAREKASFLKENISPIEESGHLKFIDEYPGKRTQFTENIEILFVNGHTKSMIIPFIKYKGRTVVYMADLIPSAGHIPLPYVASYDMFPMTSLKEKETFLEDAIKNEYILFFEHDPSTLMATVEKNEKGGFRKKEIIPPNFLD